MEKNISKTMTIKNEFEYQICPYEVCTGCFACMNKCPKRAITCTVDSQGKSIPQIHIQHCIRCGLCKEICPQLNQLELSEPKKCYAAQRLDASNRKKSASGGLAAVMSEQIIMENGSVFGAATLEGGVVSHVSAECKKEADKFRGSKYVQSYIGYSYQEVLKQLKAGRKVLFTGTPCQIAGLRKYLGKEYENLYCVDIVCHGVPPMAYLKEHIKFVLGDKQIDDLTFRIGEEDYYLRLSYKGKVVYKIERYKDPYYYAFYKGLIHRENCYNCQYAKAERAGDITLGDFWGLDRRTLKKAFSGNISLVLVNTAKGEELFSNIKEQLIWEERTIEEAIQGNEQLRQPSSKHFKREIFINEYIKNHDFEDAISKCDIKKEMTVFRLKHTQVWRALTHIKRIFV